MGRKWPNRGKKVQSFSCSLSRREESWKNKLFVYLLVCPQGQKTFLIESIKITIFKWNEVLMVENEVLPGLKNIFHKIEIIHNSNQSGVAGDQLRAVAYSSYRKIQQTVRASTFQTKRLPMTYINIKCSFFSYGCLFINSF